LFLTSYINSRQAQGGKQKCGFFSVQPLNGTYTDNTVKEALTTFNYQKNNIYITSEDPANVKLQQCC